MRKITRFEGNIDRLPYKNKVTDIEAMAYVVDEEVELYGNKGTQYLQKGDYIMYSLGIVIGMEKDKFEESHSIDEEMLEIWKRNENY